MTWFKVDDGIHSHPKFLDVSLAAVGLWTMCGAWCSAYLTDGQITRRQVQRLGGDDTLAAELVDAGLRCRQQHGEAVQVGQQGQVFAGQARVELGGDVGGKAARGDRTPGRRGDADQRLVLHPHRRAVFVPVGMLTGDIAVQRNQRLDGVVLRRGGRRSTDSGSARVAGCTNASRA